MAHAATRPVGMSEEPTGLSPRARHWRELALALWSLVAASFPLAMRYAERSVATMQPMHILRETVEISGSEAPRSLWSAAEVRWLSCSAAQQRSPFPHPSNAAYGVCEIGPARWWFRPSVEGVELIGPLPCVVTAAQHPNDSGTFFYRQSEDGRFAHYRCVDHPEQPRELTLRVEEQRRPLPSVSTPWSARAQSLRHAGPWAGLALLGLAVVALARRRHPDARSLQRRWRAGVVEGDGIATLGGGESVRLSPELSSRLPPGAPLLVDSPQSGAATYRDRPWVEADAVWPGTESSLRERVEANARRRWQLVALCASLMLALAASIAGAARVARWRRQPDVVETVGASPPPRRAMEPPTLYVEPDHQYVESNYTELE